MEIQEKAWVNQLPGTKVQDDDFICVICLVPMNEVNSSATFTIHILGLFTFFLDHNGNAHACLPMSSVFIRCVL